MYHFLDIEYRKTYTKKKIKKISNFLISLFGDRNKAGWFSVFFLHYIPHLLFFILFLYQPFNLLFLIVWITGLISHFFFKGCIHIRIERFLFDNTKWIGPYYILNYFDIKPNRPNLISVLQIALIIMLIIYLIKFGMYMFSPDQINIFYMNNSIFWILILWWVLQIFGFCII